MPKKIKPPTINLLPGKEPTFGKKFLKWSLTFGRYIIIGTEIIVLLSLVSRFKLDRDLIDLKDQIGEEQKILATLKPIEENVTRLQTRLAEIKKIDEGGGRGTLALPKLTIFTPQEITYQKISISEDKITIIGKAIETVDISRFVSQLRISELFEKDSVILEKVERSKKEKASIGFTVSAIVAKGGAK